MINGHKYLPHKYQNKSFYGEIYFDRKKSWYFPDFGLDPDPDQDPFFQKADPRIRIHIIMKRIRNTVLFTSVIIILLKIFLAFCCVFYWMYLGGECRVFLWRPESYYSGQTEIIKGNINKVFFFTKSFLLF